MSALLTNPLNTSYETLTRSLLRRSLLELTKASLVALSGMKMAMGTP